MLSVRKTRSRLRRFMGYLWITIQQYGGGENGSRKDGHSVRVEHQYRSS